MQTLPNPNPTVITQPPRRTLRDSLIEAEKLRYPVLIQTAGGRQHTGLLTEVGVDFAAVQTSSRLIYVSLFYIESAQPR
ncbi:MAG: hypothetical protein F4Y75_01055 [Acidimicrobiia bacterium]|nr:hypothetical protein [bacterium]MXX64467.1 hypothetical protein [Acidimicrobiia bacterium]MCY3652859.1 hypothetical protein [bacterium]MDE0643685.1 hypothetical protein [bacterium]MXZ06098.1 hypothetical protein [Acidimicrobiia bacterium]